MNRGSADYLPPARVRRAHLSWTVERLSRRDWAILETVNKIKLVTGAQLERLHFSSLTGRSREVARGRVLRRLVAWRLLTPVGRRVGGHQRGSTSTIYALDSAGERVLAERQMRMQPAARVRRPGAPGERTIRHTLAVAELYVSLVDATRGNGEVQLAAFDAEPACWWPNGLGGYLKPDAYLALDRSTVRAHCWVEIDLATEGLPTIKRKLGAYLDFYGRGQLGPGGVMPRVFIATVTEQRRDAIRALVAHLPAPASELFIVTLDCCCLQTTDIA
jgi:hypothetical protein